MTVRCDASQCSFYDNGFCTQRVLIINNGHCGYVFNKHGQFKDWKAPVEVEFKERIKVAEASVDSYIELDTAGDKATVAANDQ
jgi:hypothetical protein